MASYPITPLDGAGPVASWTWSGGGSPLAYTKAQSWGVYRYGTDLFCAMLSEATSGETEFLIGIWRSTDDGLTWAECDAAHRITVYEYWYEGEKILHGTESQYHGFGVCQSGSLVYVAYINAGENPPYAGGDNNLLASPVRVRAFDCATGLWGDTSPAGPIVNSAGSGSVLGARVMVTALADNSLLVAYNRNGAVSILEELYGHSSTRYALLVEGAWSAEIEVATGTSAAWYAPCALLTGPDYVHLFIESASVSDGVWTYGLTHCAIDEGASTLTYIADTIAGGTGIPCLWKDGATVRLAMPYLPAYGGTFDLGAHIGVALSSDESGSSWTLESDPTGGGLTFGSRNQWYGYVTALGSSSRGGLRLVWIAFAFLFGTTARLWSVQRTASGWSEPAAIGETTDQADALSVVIDGSTARIAFANVVTVVSATGGNATGQPYYFPYTLSAQLVANYCDSAAAGNFCW